MKSLREVLNIVKNKCPNYDILYCFETNDAYIFSFGEFTNKRDKTRPCIPCIKNNIKGYIKMTYVPPCIFSKIDGSIKTFFPFYKKNIELLKGANRIDISNITYLKLLEE